MQGCSRGEQCSGAAFLSRLGLCPRWVVNACGGSWGPLWLSVRGVKPREGRYLLGIPGALFGVQGHGFRGHPGRSRDSRKVGGLRGRRGSMRGWVGGGIPGVPGAHLERLISTGGQVPHYSRRAVSLLNSWDPRNPGTLRALSLQAHLTLNSRKPGVLFGE